MDEVRSLATFFEPLPILMDLLLTLGMMYLAQQILRKVSEKARDFTKEADPFHDAENNAEYWQRLDRGYERYLCSYQ